jgi:cell division protein FtsL
MDALRHDSARAPAEGGGGRISRLLLALAVLVGVGIATVQEHVRALRAGYRLQTLEHERESLREERRRLEIRAAKESRIDVLEERARKVALPIPGEIPPPEVVGG